MKLPAAEEILEVEVPDIPMEPVDEIRKFDEQIISP